MDSKRPDQDATTRRIAIPIGVGAGFGVIVGAVLGVIFAAHAQELAIWVGMGAPLGVGLGAIAASLRFKTRSADH